MNRHPKSWMRGSAVGPAASARATRQFLKRGLLEKKCRPESDRETGWTNHARNSVSLKKMIRFRARRHADAQCKYVLISSESRKRKCVDLAGPFASNILSVTNKRNFCNTSNTAIKVCNTNNTVTNKRKFEKSARLSLGFPSVGPISVSER